MPKTENLGSEGIMNTLVLLILVITSSLAAIKQRALQNELSPAKMMDAMLFLLIKHCMHIPQVNIHRKHRQLCLFLKETKGRSFGSNARLLSLGIIFTGCSCRWWNIHLSSAKNFSNNPVLMSAQGPGRIQPNLNRNNPAIIKKKLLEEKTNFLQVQRIEHNQTNIQNNNTKEH